MATGAITSSTTGMIDVATVVSQLMTTEQKRMNTLNTSQASYQNQLSAYGTIKGALATFQTSMSNLANKTGFQAVTATPGDATVLTSSATAAATAGTHTIQVNQLAQAQSLASVGQVSATAAIGTGTATTLSFDLGSVAGGAFTSNGAGVKTVTINAANNSLQGIRDAINAAGVGVTASIVNDGSATPFRLALVSNTTGATGNVKITAAAGGDAAVSSLMSFNPAGGAQTMTQTMAGQNALVAIDGITVSKASNTITDAIAGVTMNLQKVNATPTTLTVAKDTAGITSSVQSFVNAYNMLNQTLNSVTAYQPAGSTAPASPLAGDSMLRNLQTQIRSIIAAPLPNGSNGLTALYQAGVSFQRDGSLLLDSAKLNTAITNNFSALTGLFSASGGASDSLVSYASAITPTPGITTTAPTTKPGSYALNITQLATQGSATGSVAAGLTVTAGANDALNLTVNGVATAITLGAGTYTAAGLAAEVQAKINGSTALAAAGATVAVTQTGGVLSIASNKYGSASGVTITGGNGAASLLGTPTQVAGVDVAGTINGLAAVGTGQSLASSAGNSIGLTVSVTGGALGARGTVSYSQGYAYQLNQLAGNMLDPTAGGFAVRSNGINSTLKTISNQQASETARLARIQAQYTQQYSQLNTMLASMNQTSTYLTQQLSKL